MDLAFLLDSSASIKSSNYQIMKEFVNSVIDHFHVSDEGGIPNGRLYSLIQNVYTHLHKDICEVTYIWKLSYIELRILKSSKL